MEKTSSTTYYSLRIKPQSIPKRPVLFNLKLILLPQIHTLQSFDKEFGD